MKITITQTFNPYSKCISEEIEMTSEGDSEYLNQTLIDIQENDIRTPTDYLPLMKLAYKAGKENADVEVISILQENN